MNNCNYGFFTFRIKKLEFRVRIINHVYKIEVGIKMGIMENERLVPRVGIILPFLRQIILPPLKL